MISTASNLRPLLRPELRRVGSARRPAPARARQARRLGLRDGRGRARRRPDRRARLLADPEPRRPSASAACSAAAGSSGTAACSAASSPCCCGRAGAASSRSALVDMAGPGLALGYAIGRIGCQVSGDGDYGRAWDGPWAMGYPHGTVPTAPGVTVHPTPIYETLVMGLRGLRALAAARPRAARRALRALPRRSRALERFLIEFIRRNDDVALGLTAAQLESLSLFVDRRRLARGRRRRHAHAPHRPHSPSTRSSAYRTATRLTAPHAPRAPFHRRTHLPPPSRNTHKTAPQHRARDIDLARSRRVGAGHLLAASRSATHESRAHDHAAIATRRIGATAPTHRASTLRRTPQRLRFVAHIAARSAPTRSTGT